MSAYDDLLMQLQEQIARMNQPDQGDWASRNLTPFGQSLVSSISGAEVPWKPGPGLGFIGVEEYGGGQMREPEETDPMRYLAEESISSREAEEQAGVAEAQQKVQDLRQRAEEAQRAELASLVSDMPADKLLRIRAQARMKGRHGSLEYGGEPSAEDYDLASRPTGGGFTAAPDSPEIQQRQEDTAAWLADQPIRDAQFALTPEQAQRDPRSAALASNRLTQLKAQKSTANMQALMQGIVDSIGDSGGRVPAEEAKKLRLLGLPIPADIIGSSIESGIAFFDDAKRQAGEFLSGIDPMMASPDNPRIKFERLGAILAEDYRQRISQGMSPDDAVNAYQQEMAQLAMSLGLMNMQTMQGMQQPTEAQ